MKGFRGQELPESPKASWVDPKHQDKSKEVKKSENWPCFQKKTEESLYGCDAGLLGLLLTSHSLVPRNLGVNTDFSAEDTPSFPSIFS